MYWHVTKALKAAMKNRHLDLVRYMIEDLELSLDHEAFQKLLHLYLFSCQSAETENDEEGRKLNREIFKLLVKGKGKGAIDEVDNINSSTPLMIACESLSDLEMIQILCESGADVNSVNSDDQMPLSLIKGRLDKDQENENLRQIYDYLKSRGAVLNWRELPKND